MYVAVVPNRSSPPAILLRESYRKNGKVRTRTLANLSAWPTEKVEALRQALRGPRGGAESPFEITRTRPHGHVAATLLSARRLGLESLIAARPSRERSLVMAMIASRIIDPSSKLAMARALDSETLSHTLGESLGLQTVNADELYEAMDWLLPRQQRIETALAKRHLQEGTLALYDLTSTYFEGRKCPLAKLGHSRDDKRGTLQIVFGLLCNLEGCPVAVKVFEGNTGDPKTLASQISQISKEFGLRRVVLVGDRGMITDARLREDVTSTPGIDWITALRAPAILRLVESKALQMSLFDETDLAEISSSLFPGERLIACRNPMLAAERARKREDLLVATERELAKITAATKRKKPLRGRVDIALRVGRVLGRFKMKKHFIVEVSDDGFRYERNLERIAREADLDGIYVIRTSVPAGDLPPQGAVRAYKQLAVVERAFRSLKTVDLHVRPIHHRLADRVRAHVFLAMLAYYVEWHMRQKLRPVLFDDDDKAAGEAMRASIVAPARRSPGALDKAASKRTEDGAPVHSFRTLLKDLATIAKNRVQPKTANAAAFDLTTTPTPLQQRALDLLGVTL